MPASNVKGINNNRVEKVSGSMKSNIQIDMGSRPAANSGVSKGTLGKMKRLAYFNERQECAKSLNRHGNPDNPNDGKGAVSHDDDFQQFIRMEFLGNQSSNPKTKMNRKSRCGRLVFPTGGQIQEGEALKLFTYVAQQVEAVNEKLPAHLDLRTIMQHGNHGRPGFDVIVEAIDNKLGHTKKPKIAEAIDAIAETKATAIGDANVELVEPELAFDIEETIPTPIIPTPSSAYVKTVVTGQSVLTNVRFYPTDGGDNGINYSPLNN